MAQSDPIGVVFDFDGTLTPKEYGSLIKVVECACLPERWIKKCDKLRKTYFQNVSNSVLPSLEKKLINVALRAYRECGLSRSAWRLALDGIKLRDGVAPKIRELTSRGIRVGIISFSVADFIEYVLEVNGLGGVVHRVDAALLIYNRNSEVIGWKARSVVYPYTKNIWSAVFAKQFGIAADRLLAVGDSIGDRTLGSHKELRLGIARDENEASALVSYMGHVVVTEDFGVVDKWINKKINLILSR